MTGIVLGTGAVTSIGITAASAAAAQRAGISGHTAHPFMLDQAGEPMFVDRVPWGGQDIDGVARMIELAIPAAKEAVGELAGKRPIDLVLALPEDRPGLPQGFDTTVLTAVVNALAPDVPIGRRKATPGGPAAGVACLAQAGALLAREAEALLLVGGVDTWLVPETLEWLNSIDALHSAAMPWGFCPGEAAAFCLIGGAQRGDGRLAIVGGGEGFETNRIRTDTVCVGNGLTTAWHLALQPAANANIRVDRIWSDLNGEPYRADEIAFAMLRSRELLADEVDISTPADCWGDVGAASGALLTIAATFAAAKRYAPGPVSLVSASSDGGRRAAALLYDQGRRDAGR